MRCFKSTPPPRRFRSASLPIGLRRCPTRRKAATGAGAARADRIAPTPRYYRIVSNRGLSGGNAASRASWGPSQHGRRQPLPRPSVGRPRNDGQWERQWERQGRTLPPSLKGNSVDVHVHLLRGKAVFHRLTAVERKGGANEQNSAVYKQQTAASPATRAPSAVGSPLQPEVLPIPALASSLV